VTVVPAAADLTPTSVASAFDQGVHLYVAKDANVPVDVAQVRQAVSNEPDVYVALLPDSVLAKAGGSIDKVLSDVVSHAGAGHSYVVATPSQFGVYRPDGKGAEVYTDAFNHGGGQTAELVWAVDHASVSASLPDPNGGGGGGFDASVFVPLILVAVLVAAVVARLRRRRRDTGDFARQRADTQAEIDTLQDDLLITDPGRRVALAGMDPADDAVDRALRVAWSRQEAAAGMLAGAKSEDDVRRARLLAAQGRSALEHAQRLRDGVPGESEVYRKAAGAEGPRPEDRLADAPSGVSTRQRLLPQYTVASYPGYGYGFYPGYGYGFFNYGGSFVAGMLAGELLDGAFGAWGGGGYAYGYDQGYGAGYDQGYGTGFDQSGDYGGGDYSGGDYGGGAWGGGDMGGGDWGGGDMGGGGDSGGGGW
jgi:hypothetical protein